MASVGERTTWWVLERYIDHADEWVDEGVSFDTREEAEEELAEYRWLFSKEKFRLVECYGRLIYKA